MYGCHVILGVFKQNYTSVTLTRNLFGFSLGIVAWELGFGNFMGTLV